MWLAYFVLLLVAISNLKGTSARESCFTQGECKDGYQLLGQVVDDQYLCRQLCKGLTTCNGFTFYVKTSYCQLFKTCPVVDESDCSDCVSGDKNCSPPSLKCNLVGKCHGNLIKSEKTGSIDECIDSCKCSSNTTCHWFTFNQSNQLCELYDDCDTLTACDECLSGNCRCTLEPAGIIVWNNQYLMVL